MMVTSCQLRSRNIAELHALPEKRTCTDEVASGSRCAHRKLPSRVSLLQRNRYEHIAAGKDSLFPPTDPHERAKVNSQYRASRQRYSKRQEEGGGRRKTSAGAEGLPRLHKNSHVGSRQRLLNAAAGRRDLDAHEIPQGRKEHTTPSGKREERVGSVQGLHRIGLFDSIMVGVTVTPAVDQLSGPNYFSIHHTLWTTPPLDDNATRAG